MSGSRTVNVVSPSSLSTAISPPCCSTMWRVPASPMPLPLTVPADVRRPVVRLEDPLELGRRDADPVVAHDEDRPVLRRRAAPATTRIAISPPRGLYFTAFEIRLRDDPLDPRLVPVAEHARRASISTSIVWRGLIFWYSVGEPADDLHEVGRAVVELELVAHPDPGQVEQLVDEADQLGVLSSMTSRPSDDLGRSLGRRRGRAPAGGGWRCP